MGRWAVIREETGVVENVILWDGKARWSPPDGCFAIEVDRTVGPTFLYDAKSKSFSPPPETEPKPVEKTADEKIADLQAQVDALTKSVQELKTAKP